MNAVNAVATQGKSVICTIHQPSEQIFSMFTHLLLLRKGGEVVYFGPVHSTDDADGPRDFARVLAFFETLGFKCPEHKNPADFVLDISNNLVRGSESVDIIEKFKESDLNDELSETLANGIFPQDAPVRHHTHQYATNMFVSGLEVSLSLSLSLSLCVCVSDHVVFTPAVDQTKLLGVLEDVHCGETECLCVLRDGSHLGLPLLPERLRSKGYQGPIESALLLSDCHQLDGHT